MLPTKYASDDSDPDEPSYFTSSAPSTSSYSPTRPRRRHITDRSGYVIPSPSSRSPAPNQIVLKRPDSILEVISQLWATEGAWGVWKGSNATFVYSILLKTAESWSRSMIAAIVNVPDPGGMSGLGFMADVVDVADSPYPWTSLGVAVAAAAMAGLILAPLDIVRTKYVILGVESLSLLTGVQTDHDIHINPKTRFSP
jgi:mitochondrial fusion and transport protein UGO1